jgi:hypothetical protein
VRGNLRLGSGLTGAISVAVLNQIAKRYLPGAPRLDILGSQLATAGFKKAGIKPPQGLPVKLLALIGSLVSNSIFYGLVGLGKPNTAWLRGGLLGLAMGIGAVTLPGTVGMKNDATAGTQAAKIGTVSWYVLGGLLAAIAFAASHNNGKPSKGPLKFKDTLGRFDRC